jgi:hypothetical protein
MRPDRERQPPDPYWTHDRALGVATLFGRRYPARVKAHLSPPERYSEPAEINWFGLGEGERAFVFMRTYLTLPTFAAPCTRATTDPELDRLFGLDEPPQSVQRVIGTASAAYYPALHGLLIWEFHVAAPFRHREPVQDRSYQRLWRGVEETLLELLPQTRFLVTPGWDPEYAEDPYERFLVAMDYVPHLMHANLFMKSLPDDPGDGLSDPPRQRP